MPIIMGNPDNDGNIGLRLFNLGQSEYIIKRGDRIGQGMFVKTLRADQGDSAAKRLGALAAPISSNDLDRLKKAASMPENIQQLAAFFYSVR